MAHRDDGSPIMVADRVAEALRLGAHIGDASVRAGVSRELLRQWMRNGNRINAALDAGSRLEGDLNDQERAELHLARTAEAALSEGKLLMLALLDRLSRGAEVRTVTVRLDANGNEVDRYERTEQHVPDAAVIRWRLERRWPEEWAPKPRLEVTGPGGAPLAVDVQTRARELAQALRDANGAGSTSNGHGGNGAAHPTR